MTTSTGLQEICALIGHSVAGNPTQYMIEKAFDAAGLDWRYLSLDVPPESIQDAVRGVKALGFRGANIAAIHRESASRCVDRLSESSAAIGAITCLVIEQDAVVGENYEGKALLAALQDLIDPVGKKVAILGSGLTARAMALELATAGVSQLTIIESSVDRAQSVMELYATKSTTPAEFVAFDETFSMDAATDVLIVAAEIQAADRKLLSRFDLKNAKPDLVLVDASPPQVETALLREARLSDRPSIDGMTLLVYEAMFYFQRWTGMQPDAVLLREAAEEFLAI